MTAIRKHKEIQLFYQLKKCKLQPSMMIFFSCQFGEYCKRPMLGYVGEGVSKHTCLYIIEECFNSY